MARLAAFDMDGTLLMPDHHLGRETIATLARLRERDITLTFATGRHVLEMRHILGTLSLDAYLITGNGTRIHSLEGDVLHRQDLDPQVADTVMHHAWIPEPVCMCLMTTAGLQARRSPRYSRRTSTAAFVIRLSI